MINRVLWYVSEHGRLALITGLLAGLALPGIAAAMQPWLAQMVAALLTITALRVGLGAARGASGDLLRGTATVLALQCVLPILLFAGFWLAGLADTPAALAVVLATSAPAIAGSTNLALILRLDAGRTMQIFVLGTALFPITILPVLILMPQLGAPTEIAWTALKLLAVIVLSAGTGFGLRALLFPAPSPSQLKALDGLSVLAFSAIVVGLMAALNPALRTDPMDVAAWTVLAFAISYLAQIATRLFLHRTPVATLSGPLAIAAGNRNIALFLVALPEHLLAPLMVFIGCWQLPMYLTPVLLGWLYRGDTGHE